MKPPTPPPTRPFIAWDNPRREIPNAPEIHQPDDAPPPDAPPPPAPLYNIYFYAEEPPAYFVRMVRYGLWFFCGLFVLFVLSLMLDC